MKRSKLVFWQCVIILVLLFLGIARWLPGGDPLTPEQNIRGWLTIGILFGSFCLCSIFWGIEVLFSFRKSISALVLILFGIWASFTSLWSPNPITSIGQAISLLLIIGVTAIIVYKAASQRLSIESILLSAVGILVFFLFCCNLYLFQTLFPMTGTALRPRFALGYDHPNITSTYFAILILYASFLLLKAKPIARIALLGLIVASAIPLYLTNSRMTMAATLLVAFFIFLRPIQSRRLKWTLALIGSGLLLCAGIFFLITSDNMLTPDIMKLITLNGRVQLWAKILQESQTFLLWGNGYYASRFIYTADILWAYSAHNALLEVFASTGLIGLILILAFYLTCISFIKNFKTSAFLCLFFLYANLEGLLEMNLFVPSVVMAATCLLIFHGSFTFAKERLGSHA